jgi:signal transduction histidine kinase/CheY-like chemotaxis protein/GAF domain-containing protein
MDDERILVIDDDPQVLTLISRLLRRSGYEVEAVRDGKVALERLGREARTGDEDLALILSDLKMPHVDGLRILEEAKEHYSDTVFVLITGYATIDSAVAALRRGVYDYLTKPLDLDDLLSTVQRALEHRALVMQNKRLIEFLREKNVVLEFLHREEQRKSEQLRQVNAIARQITPILDVETLATTVIDLIEPAFDFVAPSFGLIEGEDLCFRGGWLDGQRMRAEESVFWGLTDGGCRPFVRLPPGLAVKEDDEGGPTERGPSRLGGHGTRGADRASQSEVRSDAGAPCDLVFPLNKTAPSGEQTVGFWVADWSEDAEFREENLPYLESLAAQTVVVLENARLYALAKQVDELAFLNEIGRAANESLGLEETIRSVLACVERAFAASLIEIALLDEGQEIEQAYSLMSGAFQRGELPLLGKGFVRRVGERSLVVAHTERGAATERGAQIEPDQVPRVVGEPASGADPMPLRSYLGVSLRFGEQPIGVLGVASTEPSAYSLDDGQLLQIAGGQVATAIANARLFEEVESGRRVILQSRDTLRTLFDGILEGIYIVDRHSVILAINRMQADLAGKTFPELVGHPAELAFPSSQRSLELIRETFRTGKPMSCTERQRVTTAHTELGAQDAGRGARDLSTRWTEWEIHTYPIMSSETLKYADRLMRQRSSAFSLQPSGNGERPAFAREAVTSVAAGSDGPGSRPQQVERVVVVVRDVTEQRLLEASLVQSEKMAAIGTLAAGFAHEINNPMTVISANAQILCEEISGAHPYYGSIELIDRASKRASRIVRSLLDFSRSEAFEFAPTDLNLSLREALALVETQLVKANVQLVCELEPGLPPIWASPDHLHVVWLNLLLGREGTIQVASHLRDDQVVVRIADDGIGMSEDMLKHLYEPFFTTKGPGKGTGLGLFTCYRTVARHGGEIRVDSLEGEGTVFRISLPIHRELALDG